MSYSVVSYIPALHRGYIDFFERYPGTLYILGPDFIEKAPRLDRDIRALTPDEVKTLVASLGIFSDIVILNDQNLAELWSSKDPIVLPEDEVHRQFVEEHLKKTPVTFVPVFLRWDRKISTTEFEVPIDRAVTHSAFHKEMLARAGAEADKSPDWWRQVGAVLVRDKQPLFTAHNVPLPSDYVIGAFGDPRSNFDAGEAKYTDIGKFIHAEASLIAEAARTGVQTDGTVLYVTTFPCPSCARLVAKAGIKEVYYAQGYSLLDADDIFRALGVKITLVK